MPSIISTKTSGGGGIAVTGDTSGVLQLASANGTTAVTIDASQNVGIGTATPSGYKLNVRSAATSNGLDGEYISDGTRVIIAGQSGSAYSYAGISANENVIYSAQNPLNIVADGQIIKFSTGSEQARITTAGLLQFNSGYGSVATAYGCRAWVNFNGTGTVAIRASGNVTSITDNGTGLYTVNFTNAMPDDSYCVNTAMGMLGSTNSSNSVTMINDISAVPTTSAVRIGTSFASNGTAYDVQRIYVSIFR